MKQVRITLKYYEMQALDAWIDALLQHSDHTACIAELAALAILSDWQKKKLKPKLYFFDKKLSTYTIQAPVILALLHFISNSQEPVTSYLGYCLHNLKIIIHNVYNNLQLT